jgi:hypothetical protein
MRLISIVLVASSWGICVASKQASDQPIRVGFCQVISAPATYDRKLIETRILLYQTEHALSAHGLNCEPGKDTQTAASLPDSWWSIDKEGKKLSSILKHSRTAEADVVATFDGSGGPYGGDLDPFRLEIKRLLFVEEVRK